MTGRLVDMAFTLGGKQRVTLEINGDFREIWDKLHQEQVLDVEIKSTGKAQPVGKCVFPRLVQQDFCRNRRERGCCEAAARGFVWSAGPR